MRVRGATPPSYSEVAASVPADCHICQGWSHVGNAVNADARGEQTMKRRDMGRAGGIDSAGCERDDQSAA